MPAKTLFVYGTLSFPDVVRALLDDTVPSECAVLPGYSLRKLKEFDFPAILPCLGCSVKGRLLKGVGAKELNILDAFELDLYARTEVEVYTFSQVRHATFAYVLKENSTSNVSEKPWNPQHFEKYSLDKYIASCRQWRYEYDLRI